jgi:hypothetical protein
MSKSALGNSARIHLRNMETLKRIQGSVGLESWGAVVVGCRGNMKTGDLSRRSNLETAIGESSNACAWIMKVEQLSSFNQCLRVQNSN